MTAKDWIEISDCPYSGKFLIYILEKNRVMKSDFRSITGSSMINKTLDFLKDHELVKIEEIRKPYHTFYVTLTEKGETKAKHYLAIDKDIESKNETNLSSPSEEGDTVRE